MSVKVHQMVDELIRRANDGIARASADLARAARGVLDRMRAAVIPSGVCLGCGDGLGDAPEAVRYCSRDCRDEATRRDEPVAGACCAGGYDEDDVTPCAGREDETHCNHWWDGKDDDMGEGPTHEHPRCPRCGGPVVAATMTTGLSFEKGDERRYPIGALSVYCVSAACNYDVGLADIPYPPPLDAPPESGGIDAIDWGELSVVFDEVHKRMEDLNKRVEWLEQARPPIDEELERELAGVQRMLIEEYRKTIAEKDQRIHVLQRRNDEQRGTIEQYQESRTTDWSSVIAPEETIEARPSARRLRASGSAEEELDVDPDWTTSNADGSGLRGGYLFVARSACVAGCLSYEGFRSHHPDCGQWKAWERATNPTRIAPGSRLYDVVLALGFEDPYAADWDEVVARARDIVREKEKLEKEGLGRGAPRATLELIRLLGFDDPFDVGWHDVVKRVEALQEDERNRAHVAAPPESVRIAKLLGVGHPHVVTWSELEKLVVALVAERATPDEAETICGAELIDDPDVKTRCQLEDGHAGVHRNKDVWWSVDLDEEDPS